MKDKYKHFTPDEKEIEYEILKRELNKLNLSVKEYDKEIDRIVEELGL